MLSWKILAASLLLLTPVALVAMALQSSPEPLEPRAAIVLPAAVEGPRVTLGPTDGKADPGRPDSGSTARPDRPVRPAQEPDPAPPKPQCGAQDDDDDDGVLVVHPCPGAVGDDDGDDDDGDDGDDDRDDDGGDDGDD